VKGEPRGREKEEEKERAKEIGGTE